MPFPRGLFVLALALICTAAPALPATAQSVQVEVAEARLAPVLNRVRLTGSVVSPRRAQLSVEIAGLIARMGVRLGDRVQQGAVLVQLDPALERIALQNAEAATREALEELADAWRRLEVGQQLAERSAIPQNELDAREAVVRIAQAKVDRLEIDEARYRERLRRHGVTAPFAGVIAATFAEVGEWVVPGTAVLELVEISGLLIEVPVPQRYFPELRQDTGISIAFDALPGRDVPAVIDSFVPVSDATSRSFILRLRPQAQNLQIIPGMSARVILELASGERGILVSRDAVIRFADGRTVVWVVTEQDGKTVVQEQRVTLGSAFEGQVQVLDGLSAGQSVVVRGNEALQPGQEVRVAETG